MPKSERFVKHLGDSLRMQHTSPSLQTLSRTMSLSNWSVEPRAAPRWTRRRPRGRARRRAGARGCVRRRGRTRQRRSGLTCAVHLLVVHVRDPKSPPAAMLREAAAAMPKAQSNYTRRADGAARPRVGGRVAGGIRRPPRMVPNGACCTASE